MTCICPDSNDFPSHSAAELKARLAVAERTRGDVVKEALKEARRAEELKMELQRRNASAVNLQNEAATVRQKNLKLEDEVHMTMTLVDSFNLCR